MNILLGIIVGLLILTFLVVMHEGGHYLMAVKSGVKVNEFGIGFRPIAIAWVKNPKYQKKSKKDKNKAGKVSKKIDEKFENPDWLANAPSSKKWIRIPREYIKEHPVLKFETLVFSLNCLPIGGFCAMDGESDADTKKGTFGAASFWGKTKILFGGVTANWLVAIITFTILAWTGMPQFITNQFRIDSDAARVGQGVIVADVLENSPAEFAGIKNGDQLIKVDEVEILYPTDMIEYNNQKAGEEVRLTVSRDDEEIEIPVNLNSKDAEYLLGVQMDYGQVFVRSTWSAPVVGVMTTLQLTGETFKGLGDLVYNFFTGIFSQFSSNEASRQAGQVALSVAGESVSGPVGIIGTIFPAFVNAGATNLAFLMALISVSLACMNVLPIPALDGGRWLLIAISRIRGKPLKKETEEKIIAYAFLFLIALIIIITILDITKLF